MRHTTAELLITLDGSERSLTSGRASAKFAVVILSCLCITSSQATLTVGIQERVGLIQAHAAHGVRSLQDTAPRDKVCRDCSVKMLQLLGNASVQGNSNNMLTDALFVWPTLNAEP
jgi:hypothetical protein